MNETNPFGWFVYDQLSSKPIHLICDNGFYFQQMAEIESFQSITRECGQYAIEGGSMSLEDISRSVSFRYDPLLRLDKTPEVCNNLFVSQQYIESENRYERKLLYIDTTFDLRNKENTEGNRTLLILEFNKVKNVVLRDRRLLFLERIDDKLEIIGIFLSKATLNIHVLLRSANSPVIEYCTFFTNSVNECLDKKYKLLIDCSQSHNDKNYIVIISIVIIVLIAIVLIIIITCFSYFISKRSKKDRAKTMKQTKHMTSYLIQTIHSDTGLPISKTFYNIDDIKKY